jgi:uncharacterized protein YecT (DUF1311 family)
MNPKLNAAFEDLDFEQSSEETQRVKDVLNATRAAWLNMTQADYDRLIWEDERIKIQQVEIQMNGVDK